MTDFGTVSSKVSQRLIREKNEARTGDGDAFGGCWYRCNWRQEVGRQTLGLNNTLKYFEIAIWPSAKSKLQECMFT